jgi:hypothetical protein
MEAQMTAFIALYKGETVAGARLVALTADPGLVQDFAAKLITEEPPEEDRRDGLRLAEDKEKPGSTTNPGKSTTPSKGVLDR